MRTMKGGIDLDGGKSGGIALQKASRFWEVSALGGRQAPSCAADQGLSRNHIRGEGVGPLSREIGEGRGGGSGRPGSAVTHALDRGVPALAVALGGGAAGVALLADRYTLGETGVDLEHRGRLADSAGIG